MFFSNIDRVRKPETIFVIHNLLPSLIEGITRNAERQNKYDSFAVYCHFNKHCVNDCKP